MSFFKGKTVYVTGATSGLGLEMAKQLVVSGAHVAIFGRKHLEKVHAQLEAVSQGGSLMHAHMETTDMVSVKQAMHTACDTLGLPDIVIHSAGVGKMRPFNDLTQEDFEWVQRVNVFGTRNIAEASFEYLKQTKGQLMLLSSVAGMVPNHSYSAYAASKFSNVGLAEVLRYEWKPFGVAVKLACPPSVMTPLVEEELRESPKESQILKAFAGYLDIEFACRYMLNGLSKRGFYIVPGFKAKMLLLSQRFFPSVNRFVADLVIKFYHKKNLNKNR